MSTNVAAGSPVAAQPASVHLKRHLPPAEGLPVWRIFPVAHSNDSRWQDRPIWAEVIVRAPSATMARLIAATSLSGDSALARVGNESGSGRSGIEDGVLYWATRLSDEVGAGLAENPGAARLLKAVKLRDGRRL